MLDKQQRVDAIISSLREQGQEDTIQDVQDMITQSESAQLTAVKRTCDKCALVFKYFHNICQNIFILILNFFMYFQIG